MMANFSNVEKNGDGAHEFEEVFSIDDRLLAELRNMSDFLLSEEVKQNHLKMLADLPDTSSLRIGRRITIFALAASAFIAIGLGTAAALGVFTAPVADRSIAYCYATSEPGGVGNHFEIAIATAAGEPATIGDAATIAVDRCRRAWRDGTIRTDEPYLNGSLYSTREELPAPPLIACVLTNGHLGVFPGAIDVCDEMGLPVAEH